MEFQLSWYLHGYQVNDNMDFREVEWKFDRLKEKLEDKENSDAGMQEEFRKLTS